MSDVTIGVVIFAAVGIVFIGLGSPLYQKRVPPNSWYGCRTKKSLSDEKTWYTVNRVTGREMIVAGFVVISSAALMFVFGRNMNGNYATGILLAILLLSGARMVIRSFKTLKQM
jgi:uncharacterized membrane protein